ncbi:FliM/FliN family flagellar motor switch protein [Candidatus Binatia bacterium]|nr:FliM/FliN family flagellar motor switch protein [Candidatus Binatia bacterium]
MADALTREEIDAMLRGMADGEVAVEADASPRGEATPVSLVPDRDENPGRRFPALALIHERFVRELNKVLLQLFEANINVDRKDTFSIDFLTVKNRIAPGTVASLFTLAPFGGEVLLLLPPALSFEMVDRLFGGPGRIPPDVGERELSPISLRTVEGLVSRMMEAFAAGFSPLVEVQSTLVRSETNPMLLDLAGANESVVGFETDVDLGAGTQRLTIVLPQTVLESARARFNESKALIPRIDRNWLGALRGAVELTDVVLSADLGRLELTTRQVLSLRPGDVLHLSTRGEDALPIRVEGTPLMTGVAGVSRGRNAVRILGFDAAELHLGD